MAVVCVTLGRRGISRAPGAPALLPHELRAWAGGRGLPGGWQGPRGSSWAPSSPRASPGAGRIRLVCATLCPLFMDGVGAPLTSVPTPPAAQEARNKFEEAERSLKDMEESIRYEPSPLPCGHLLPDSPEAVAMGKSLRQPLRAGGGSCRESPQAVGTGAQAPRDPPPLQRAFLRCPESGWHPPLPLNLRASPLGTWNRRFHLILAPTASSPTSTTSAMSSPPMSASPVGMSGGWARWVWA